MCITSYQSNLCLVLKLLMKVRQMAYLRFTTGKHQSTKCLQGLSLVLVITVLLFVSQVRDTPDEAYPARSSQRNLHQAAGGGEREEGQLRPRGLFSRLICDCFMNLSQAPQV